MTLAKQTKAAVIQGALEIYENKDLSQLIDWLAITQRNWEVLEARCGFDIPMSLSQIAVRHGFTRARAAQIVANSSGKLAVRAVLLAPALASLQSDAPALCTLLRKRRNANFLTSCQRGLWAAGWSEASHQNVRRLMIAARVVSIADVDGAAKIFPGIKALIHCLASIDLAAAARPAATTRPLSVASLAELVLAGVRKPLHYTQIHAEAEKRQPSKPPSLRAIAETLPGHPNVFARVGRGIYGLSIWGLETVLPYKALVEAALKAAGKPLTFGSIFQDVNAKRPIKKTTLLMCLDLHRAFYKSMEGTYGLRTWLPARRKQTIRTPAWQVEDPRSYQRLAWADPRTTAADE